jgi:hypothetical protein
MLVWFKQAWAVNSPITCSILCKSATDFDERLQEEFKVTDGYLMRWKVIYENLHGGKQDSDGLAPENSLGNCFKCL